MKKRELWLIGAVCLFVGIVHGLKKAKWTHGVSLGSYNGQTLNSHNGPKCAEEDCCDCQNEEECGAGCCKDHACGEN